MRICIFFLILAVAVSICKAQRVQTSDQINELTIVIMVSDDIYSGIEESIGIYVSDLQKEKYNVVVKESSMTTPEEVRAYLQNLYVTVSPPLVGALLIGNIPYAWQFFINIYTNPDIQPTQHNFISFQFYSDLDGTFEKNNANYPNSYSDHYGETFPEIWIGILPMYHKNTQETINKVKWYFEKNHEYRTGSSGLESGYLQVNEFTNAETQQEYDLAVDGMVDGQYSWSPLTKWGNTSFYVTNSVGLPSPSEAFNKGLADLFYKIAVLEAHGSPSTNGSLSTDMVKSITIRPAIIWLEGCNTGDLTYDNNILTEIIYNSNSKALVGKGGTSNVGGLGNNENGFYGHNIAEALLQGISVGDALLTHFCTPLIYPWSNNFEMHNAPNVFVGDLTLTLFPAQLDSNQLPTPTLRFPPYGATAITTNPTLVWWNSSPGGTAYRVQLSTSHDFSTTLLDQSGITTNSLEISGLSINSEYFWRVNATNENGTSDWSNIRNFDTTPLQSTIHVPGDYPTIQQALDVVMPGGIIKVAPGVYKETFKMKNGVSLIGSGFTDTIIDGQGIGNESGSVVVGEENSQITGFTIRNANLSHSNNLGAGIDGGSSTFSIYGNWITNCRIGIRAQGSPMIERNVIVNNLVLAGIAVYGSGTPTIINNTIVNNDRGIQVSQNATPDIVNNIIVNNRVGIINFSNNVLPVRYNNIFGNNVNYDMLDDQTGLNGNISVDPLFVDPAVENYHLLEDSPCINAGDPTTTLDLDGTVADIGKFIFDPDFIEALSVSISIL